MSDYTVWVGRLMPENYDGYEGDRDDLEVRVPHGIDAGALVEAAPKLLEACEAALAMLKAFHKAESGVGALLAEAIEEAKRGPK